MSRHLRQLKDESDLDNKTKNIDEEIENGTNNFNDLVPNSAKIPKCSPLREMVGDQRVIK